LNQEGVNGGCYKMNTDIENQILDKLKGICEVSINTYKFAELIDTLVELRMKQYKQKVKYVLDKYSDGSNNFSMRQIKKKLGLDD